MNTYTVYLYRSGRVFIMVGEHPYVPHDIDQPILTRVVEANTEIAALGKLLLEQLDRANQPYQSIPICIEWCCEYPCQHCHKPLREHDANSYLCEGGATEYEPHD